MEMAVWVTGDIHGNPARFSTDIFPEQKEMTIGWKRNRSPQCLWMEITKTIRDLILIRQKHGREEMYILFARRLFI